MQARLLLAAILCSVAIKAQTPAAATTNQKKGGLSGVVLNAVSKEPLRRAEVILTPVGNQQFVMSGPDGPPGTRRATTDQEGKYTFADVEKGRYQLAAQKSSFLRGNYGSRSGSAMSMGTQLELSEGQTIGDLKIELTPQGVISGRVVDEEGEPIQNLQVMALRQRYFRGKAQMMPFGNAQTNDRGEFRVLNISPGQIVVQITPQRWSGNATGATDANPNMAYVTTYYPGVTDMTQATKVDVGPGAELSGFEIKLQKAKVVRIRGKVFNAQGEPAKNYFVNLMPKDAMFFGPMGQNFTRSGDGVFELNAVQPGTYTLHAQSEMGSPRAGSYREAITVGSDNIDDLVIRMTPPVRVEGVVVVKGDIKVDVQTVRVSLMDESGRMGMGMGMNGQQNPKEDGTFAIEGVSPGKYRVQAFFMPVDGAFVESIQYGDQEVLGKEVEVAAGGSASIRVTVNSGAGSVTGAVTKDSVPAPGASVVLINSDRSKMDSMTSGRVGPTDQTAKFNIKSVPPGDYLAFAFENLEEYGFWDDEERFKKIASKAVKVSVPRGGSANAALSVTPIPE